MENINKTITNLNSLKINKLSQERYNYLVENNQINSNELYLTPDGENVQVIGKYASAEGTHTIAEGDYSHAEGSNTRAVGEGSHVEGFHTQTTYARGHAEGDHTVASWRSHAEGAFTKATGSHSHAEGAFSQAKGSKSHAEGCFHQQVWIYNDIIIKLAEDINVTDENPNPTLILNTADHGLVVGDLISLEYYNGETFLATDTREIIKVEGNKVDVNYTFNEKYNCSIPIPYPVNTCIRKAFPVQASGSIAHAEGCATLASGEYSHAEGGPFIEKINIDETIKWRESILKQRTTASGKGAHAEGIGTKATNIACHSEGQETIASGKYAHAEGHKSKANSECAHAEGENTFAMGLGSHTEGLGFNPIEILLSGNANSKTYTCSEGLNIYTVTNVNAENNYGFKFEGGYWESQNKGVNNSYALCEVTFTLVNDSLVQFEVLNDAERSFDYAIFSRVNVSLERSSEPDSNYYHRCYGESGKHIVSYGTLMRGTHKIQIKFRKDSSTHSYSDSLKFKLMTTDANWINVGNVIKLDDISAIVTSIETNTITLDKSLSSNTLTNKKVLLYNIGSFGEYSHSENNSFSLAKYSHAEGEQSISSGNTSHAEGGFTISLGDYSHAEGLSTVALGNNSHAEGWATEARGVCSHAEGINTQALGSDSHAEGYNTVASGSDSHAEGDDTVASGQASHAEGNNTVASGYYSHAEGDDTVASGHYSHASGLKTTASGNGATVMGGKGTIASGNYSFAGGQSSALADGAIPTTASGDLSFAFGGTPNRGARATNTNSTAFGDSLASGERSFAIGNNSEATNKNSFAGGIASIASGENSFAFGNRAKATRKNQFAIGQWGDDAPSGTLFSIGGGTSDTDRKNVVTMDKNGNAIFAGKVTVGTTTPTADGDLISKKYLSSNYLTKSYIIDNYATKTALTTLQNNLTPIIIATEPTSDDFDGLADGQILYYVEEYHV